MKTFNDLFVSDTDKANNGVPIVVGYNVKNEPVTLFIAEAGNPGHEKAQRQFAKELEVSRRNRKHRQRINARIIAIGVLKTWEGVLDDDGNPVDPTVDNKVAALLKYKKMYLRVLQESDDPDNYRSDDPDEDLDEDDLDEDEALEDTSGNLQAS